MVLTACCHKGSVVGRRLATSGGGGFASLSRHGFSDCVTRNGIGAGAIDVATVMAMACLPWSLVMLVLLTLEGRYRSRNGVGGGW